MKTPESKPYTLPTDDFGIHRAAEAGVAYQAYQPMFVSKGLSGKDWAKLLHVSERTLQRMQEDKRTLDVDASERLLEINRLFEHGGEVFGSEERFRTWIGREVLALGGRRPIDLMQTLAGIRLVNTELGRIEWGMPA